MSEQCAKCSAPLADDQRYCLQCGEPRPHVSGPPSRTLEAPTKPLAPLDVPAIPSASSNGRNNTLALLAGIGVLLLAMGVGVLIGRADAGSAKVPPAQVISLGGTAAGSSTTATTPTSETPAANAVKKTAKAKASSSSGTGSSISKPAPPTVLKSVSKSQSGSSYEQKSKNLPDVVETG